MLSQEPSFESLLYSVSTVLSSTGDPEAKVEQVVDLIVRHLGSVTVSLSLQTARGVAFAERRNSSRTRSQFAFEQRISVGGSALGRFNLEVDVLTGGAAVWLRTLETITQLLTLYAQNNLFDEENRRLLDSARAMEEDLRTEKLLTRAGGIVASAKGLSQPAARQWILTEARKHSVGINAFCDQMILRYVAHSQPEPSSPASGDTAKKDWAAA